MPQYLFQSTTSDETVELFYSMKDVPVVGAVVKHKGAKWRRVFTIPRTNIDTKIDPFSEKEFREKTYAKKGETLGSMFDRSKELSEQRASKLGVDDPVRAKYFADYRKRKRGTPHTAELAEGQKKAKEKLDKGLAALGLKMSQMPKITNT